MSSLRSSRRSSLFSSRRTSTKAAAPKRNFKVFDPSNLAKFRRIRLGILRDEAVNLALEDLQYDCHCESIVLIPITMMEGELPKTPWSRGLKTDLAVAGDFRYLVPKRIVVDDATLSPSAGDAGPSSLRVRCSLTRVVSAAAYPCMVSMHCRVRVFVQWVC